jgi:hypothetical protein
VSAAAQSIRLASAGLVILLNVKICRTSPSDFGGETVQTANPLKTNGFFEVKRGFRRDAVDARNPFANEFLNRHHHLGCLWVM